MKPENLKTIEMLQEVLSAQIPVADYIPYSTHITTNVVTVRKSGAFLATWKLEGITFETSDIEDIEVKKNTLINYLKTLSGGQYAVWTHKVRRYVNERLDGTYVDDFCREFNEAYYSTFDNHRQIATELYFTVIYRPNTSNITNLFSKFFNKVQTQNLEQRREQEQQILDTFEDIANQLEHSLFRFNPERLDVYTKNETTYSGQLSFYGYLINGVWEDVPYRRYSISEYLPTSRIHFGDQNGMLEIWHPKEQKYAGIMDFQDYPKFSEPGMLNSILYGDYEYIETQSFSIMNKRDALEAIERIQGQLLSSEDASTQEIEEMKVALDQVASGVIDMGEYHYSLAIFGNNLPALAKNLAHARARLQDGTGFKMSIVDAVPECAWFAQLPANWSMRPREASITSRNFVNLSPLHNFASGKRNGNPWGEALALFKTPSGQPYYANLHVSADDVDATDDKLAGNTFVCGTTGVGKTTLIMSLLIFARKYKGLRAIFFDLDRGAEIAIRVMGGKYKAIRRGEPTGFNPFQMEATEKNIQFCVDLFKLLLTDNGRTPLNAREEMEATKAVRTVMSNEVRYEFRCLSAVDQNLSTGTDENNSLRLRLRKWLRNESLGWVFDNAANEDFLSGSTLFGFDYTEFLDDAEIRTPITAWLLYLTDSLMNGQPFMFFMEEFWKPLMDGMFTEYAKKELKTIRKKSGLGVFITQSPSDAIDHEIGKTIIEQCVTQIYLPNPRADHHDYVDGFKVSEAEFNIIRNLGENSRMILIKQGQRSAIVKFDLSGLNELINLVSGSEDNLRLLDEIRSEFGDDSKVWRPLLKQRIAARKKLI